MRNRGSFLPFSELRHVDKNCIIAGIAKFFQGTPPGDHEMENDHEHPRAQSSATDGRSRILRLKEVCKFTGLGRSFIYQLQADDQFPRSIKIGVRAVGWLEHEVQEWVERRTQLSRSRFGQPG